MTGAGRVLVLGALGWLIASAGPVASFEPLEQDEDRWCMLGGDLCAGVEGEKVAVLLVHGNRHPFWELREAFGSRTLEIWPYIIRLPGERVMFGVVERRNIGFSGGWSEGSEVHLFSVAQGSEPEASLALSLPLDSMILNRACFSDEDRAARLGACHDSYEYSTTLEPLGDARAMAPEFRITVEATRHPTGVSLFRDSLQMPPLTEAQLQVEVDATCSFSRVFRWDEATLTYRPDTPLPDCSEFTDF